MILPQKIYRNRGQINIANYRIKKTINEINTSHKFLIFGKDFILLIANGFVSRGRDLSTLKIHRRTTTNDNNYSKSCQHVKNERHKDDIVIALCSACCMFDER